MATRETLPVESEPYTKGYYMIWGVLSFAAIIYIAYLAFGSGSAPIIKISKVSEKPSVATLVNEQSRRIGSAMAIATRAADKSAANATAIKSLEKRVQLLTWKMSDGEPVTGVSNTDVSNIGRSGNDMTSLGNRANGYVKQVMGNSGDDSGIVGHVIAGTSDAVKRVIPKAAKKIVTTKVVKTVAIDAISSIAGVVDMAPGSSANIINPVAKNLDTLNPLKVAALAAGIAKSAHSAGTNSAKSDAGALVQKAAVKASDVTEVVQPVSLKSPFKIMPLPVRKSYGVRLTSGQSVEALRLTWDLINEMNRPILKGLTTRFIERPSGIGMPYRLIAGPVVSTGQAQTICDKLHKQNINCAVTVFQGAKL